MQVEVVSTYEGLLRLESDWKYIFEKSQSNNPCVSWEFFSLWWKHYANDQKMLILLVKDGTDIIGIAPLMSINGNFVTLRKPIIRFLSDDTAADYMDFVILCNNKEVVRTILHFLVKLENWGRIDLRRIPICSTNLEEIKAVSSSLRYPCMIKINCVSPIVRIEGTWDSYCHHLSKGLRQDIRTTLNKLRKIGEIRFEVSEKNNLKVALDALFNFHKGRQIYKPGRSIFESEKYCNFISDLAFTFFERGWAELSTLKVNGRIISVVFGLKMNKVFYYCTPAFDPSFSKYSLGKLHIYFLLKNCFEQGYDKFDFTIGDEPYKLKWANDSMENYEIKIYKNDFLYRLDISKFLLKHSLKSLKSKSTLLEKAWKKISKIKWFSAK